jgi:rfaE bifunctional protein kinase chain/domain
MTAVSLAPSSQADLEHLKKVTAGKRVVFAAGNFNILHPGHLRLLRFARECGDYLVVGVLDSDSPDVFVDDALRLESLQAIQWVNHAFILNTPPETFIRELKPSVVVKGNEHESRVNPEAEALTSYGGKLLFCSGDSSFSSIDLLLKDWREINLSSIRKPQDYLSRHAIEKPTVLELLEKMKRLRVCVIGDTIVDEYITCDPIGMSQEDPTIVVTPIMHEKFIGGAGIVAAHAHSLGCRVNFFSVLGDDATAAFVRSTIPNHTLKFHAYVDDSRPTTLKQRYRASQKTLLRVSHLRQHDITSELREKMRSDIMATLDETDLLIFADFNYGCLPQALVAEITAACAARGIMMVADSQSSSQVGDVSRFYGMELITPTEREARLAMQDFDSGLVVLAERLKEKARAKNVVITLGAEGLLIHTTVAEGNRWPTDRLPALNSAPKDAAGAGDSFLTCAAMALVVGADIWQASYLGSLAAACQVGRVGNIPLTHQELIGEIQN